MARGELLYQLSAFVYLPGERRFTTLDTFPMWPHQVKIRLAWPLALIVCVWLSARHLRDSARAFLQALHPGADGLARAILAIKRSFVEFAVMKDAILLKEYPYSTAYMSLQRLVMASRQASVNAWGLFDEGLQTPNFSGLLHFADSRVVKGISLNYVLICRSPFKHTDVMLRQWICVPPLV